MRKIVSMVSLLIMMVVQITPAAALIDLSGSLGSPTSMDLSGTNLNQGSSMNLSGVDLNAGSSMDLSGTDLTGGTSMDLSDALVTSGAAVRILSINNITANAATINYDGKLSAANTALSYEICISKTSSANSCEHQVNTLLESFTVSNLQPSTQYHAKVRVFENGKLGNPSNTMVFTTLAANPSNRAPSVTDLVSHHVTDTEATLEWNSFDLDQDTLDFDVCVSKNTNDVMFAEQSGSTIVGSPNCMYHTYNGNEIYTLTGLDKNTTYYWSVRARDDDYSVFANQIKSFKTLNEAPVDNTPTTNHEPVVELAGPNNGAVLQTNTTTLSWVGVDADSDDLDYTVYLYEVDENDTASYTSATIKSNQDFQFTTSDPTRSQSFTGTYNKKYWWTVEANDGTDSALATTAYRFTFNNDAPTITMNMPANAVIADTSTTLTWTGTDPENDTLSYSLYVLEVAQNDLTNVTTADVIANGTSQTLSSTLATSLIFSGTDHMKYHWVVTVNDGVNATVLPTNPKTFVFDTTTGNSAPVVTLTNPTNGASRTTTAITLDWTATDADGDSLTYELFLLEVPVSDAASYSHEQIAVPANSITIGQTATSYSFTATDQMKYHWTVRVSDGIEASYPTSVSTFTVDTSGTSNSTPTVTLQAPTDGVTVASTTTTLVWVGQDTDGDALTYRLFVLEVPTSDLTNYSATQVAQAANEVTLVSNTVTSHTFTGTNGMKYHWIVEVNDGTTPNLSSKANTFVLDTTATNSAPVVTLTYPTNGATVNTTTPTLLWSGTDANADTLAYELYVLAVPVSDTANYANEQIAVAANRITLPVNTAVNYALSATDGMKYHWTVRATDGQVSSYPASSSSFTVNATTGNTAPVLTLTNPTNGSTSATTTNTLTWSATDADGDALSYTLYTYEVALADTTNYSNSDIITLGSRQLTMSAQTSFALTSTNQRRVLWTVEVTDGVQVTLPASPFSFTVDSSSASNTAPTVTLTSPANGSTSTTVTNTLSWAGNDVDGDALTYRLFVYERPLTDSATYTNTDVMTLGTEVALNPTSLTSVAYTSPDTTRVLWTVQVSDAAVTSLPAAPFSLSVDTGAAPNTAPTVTATSPTDAAVLTNVNTTLQWSGSDTDGDTLTYEVYVLEVPQNDAASYNTAQIRSTGVLQTLAANTNTSVGFTATDNRNYWWTVRASDGTTTTDATPFHFTVDTGANVAPVVTLTAPSHNMAYTSRIANLDLEYSATDANGGLLTYEIFVLKVPMNDTTPRTSQQIIDSGTLIATTQATSFNYIVENAKDYWWTVRVSDGSLTDLPDTPFRFTVRFEDSVVLTPSSSGGGGGYSGGGGGGSGNTANTVTPVSLPVDGSDALITAYSPVKFKNTDGLLTVDLRHTNLGTKDSVRWQKGTQITDLDGNNYTGTYQVPQLLTQNRVDADAMASFPEEVALLYPYLTQYGDLAEQYSEPVTISGRIKDAYLAEVENALNPGVIGYNPITGSWEVLGRETAFKNGTFSVKVPYSTVLAVVDLNSFDTDESHPDVEDQEDNGDTATDMEALDHSLCTDIAVNNLFTDVSGHWGTYYICRLYRKGAVRGYVSGELAGSFGPDRSVTRAELLKTVMQLYGYNVQNIDTTGKFSDVVGNEWYAPYVVRGNELGIVTGYGDGTFKPNQVVNRAEALKIILLASPSVNQQTIDIQRAVEYADVDHTAGFWDVTEDLWFAPYVSYAVARGIISGHADGMMHAGDGMTRAEMAKVVWLSYIN